MLKTIGKLETFEMSKFEKEKILKRLYEVNAKHSCMIDSLFFFYIKDSLRVLMNNKILDNFNVRGALDLNKRLIKNNLFYIYYYSINFFLSKKL